jgi:hypothetical protein
LPRPPLAEEGWPRLMDGAGYKKSPLGRGAEPGEAGWVYSRHYFSVIPAKAGIQMIKIFKHLLPLFLEKVAHPAKMTGQEKRSLDKFPITPL